MPKIPFGEALAAFKIRNESLISLYRDRIKTIPPGPIGSLTASIAEQRRDLARDLSKILSSFEESPLRSAEIEYDSPLDTGVHDIKTGSSDAIELLRFIKEAEDSDFERLSELAGAVLPISSAVAEFLAAEASGAKKRASWAQDHLDLLGLSKS